MRHRLKATLTAALVITVACSDAAGPSGPPNTLRFTTPPETVRQGEPASFAVEVFDDTGTPIEQAALSWSVEPLGAGDFPLDARFVGYQPGPVTVIVSQWITGGILWLSWYQDGIYAVDATGELLGRLDRQGRTIMQVNYIQESTGCFDIIGNDTCTWAPQLHNGLLYVSDVNSGLWIFRPEF